MHTYPKRWRALLGLVLLAGLSLTQAAPQSELWERWVAHDPQSGKEIDHTLWQRFLDERVRRAEDGVNRIPYGKVDGAGRRLVDDYIAALTAVPISSFSRSEQLAYWMNLYNALTVKVVFDHYPVESILDINISPGLLSSGPWGKRLITVEGEELSLDDIEHRILRPIWKDPRVHYGVNCASIGCPNLRKQAFTAASVDAALEEAAREYVNGERGARFVGEKLEVSSIYHWFEEDFGGDDEGVIEHLSRYAEPELGARLADATRISSDFYDWALNDGQLVESAKPDPAGSDMR